MFTSEGLQRASPGYSFDRIWDAVEKAGWVTEHNPNERWKRVRMDGGSPYLVQSCAPNTTSYPKRLNQRPYKKRRKNLRLRSCGFKSSLRAATGPGCVKTF